MDYNVINQLTVQFEDEEINTFLVLLDKLYKTPKRVGFKKEVTNEERSLIEDMYNKLVNTNEEDTGQDQ